MRVLVTDGDNRAALAVTRSLGRRGHFVLVGEKQGRALAHASRYCAKQVVYPDPVSEDGAFLDSVAQAVASERVDVILPVADITTLLITASRALFEPACRVPFAGGCTVAKAADKVAVMQAAESLGVPIPRTWYLASQGDRVPRDVPFPVVLKPHRSRVRTAAGWRPCSVSYARSSDELQRALESSPPHHFPLMLQERIAGPGMGVFVCCDRGRLIAIFGHRRLREKPPWGGVSVLCESTVVCPQARDYAERLLKHLDWQGVAMVEFKRDVRDGLPKLMEINGRFWGSLQLAIDAGVDFPAILLATVEGLQSPVLPPYRVGVKSRWLWGDIDSLLLRLRSRKGDWPAQDGRGRIGAMMQFLRFVDRDLYYDNPKADDVRPWLRESWRRVWP